MSLSRRRAARRSSSPAAPGEPSLCRPEAGSARVSGRRRPAHRRRSSSARLARSRPAADRLGAGMGRLHVLAPDFAGQARAGDALHLRGVVIADPDGRDELGGEAHEPGVAVILRRAGLAADLPARDVELAAGAAVHDAVEHGVDHGEVLRLDDRAEIRGLARVDDLAIGLAHLADDIGQHRLAAIGESRIGRRQLQRRHLRCAERQRQIRLQGRVDAEALRRADDLLGVTSWISRAATVLSECCIAVASVTGPR